MVTKKVVQSDYYKKSWWKSSNKSTSYLFSMLWSIASDLDRFTGTSFPCPRWKLLWGFLNIFGGGRNEETAERWGWLKWGNVLVVRTLLLVEWFVLNIVDVTESLDTNHATFNSQSNMRSDMCRTFKIFASTFKPVEQQFIFWKNWNMIFRRM